MNTKIEELLNQIGRSDMLTTAYDTAWVARIKEIDLELSNKALDWLAINQLPDGHGERKNHCITTIASLVH